MALMSPVATNALRHEASARVRSTAGLVPFCCELLMELRIRDLSSPQSRAGPELELPWLDA
jgi:hypothetical protein